MTLSSKQRTLLIVVLTVLLLLLAKFGGGYRSLGTLFLPLGLWFSLKREPEQAEIRPAIRVLGWIFVCVAAIAIVASVIAITAGR